MVPGSNSSTNRLKKLVSVIVTPLASDPDAPPSRVGAPAPPPPPPNAKSVSDTVVLPPTPSPSITWNASAKVSALPTSVEVSSVTW